MTALTLTPPPHLRGRIEAEAADKGVTVAQLIATILDAATRQEPKPERGEE